MTALAPTRDTPPEDTATLSPATLAAGYVDGQTPHDRLESWLNGDGIDAALKAMNVSAVSKKPGRVVKRLEKSLGALFERPRVVKWEKEGKVVFAPAFTATTLGAMVAAPDEAPRLEASDAEARVIAQTDLYFRANDDVTEVNATVVAALAEPALVGMISDLGLDRAEAGKAARASLTAARIVQTGLAHADLGVTARHDLLVPVRESAMRAMILPVERIEFEEKMLGQMVVLAEWVPSSRIPAAAEPHLEAMRPAMTKDGYPGPEGFAALIRAAL